MCRVQTLPPPSKLGDNIVLLVVNLGGRRLSQLGNTASRFVLVFSTSLPLAS